MLKTFAAALLATSLVAGTALAASDAGKPVTPAPQTQTAPAMSKAPVKHHAAVKHTKKTHVSRARGTIHQARHGKPVKSHQASTAKPAHRS